MNAVAERVSWPRKFVRALHARSPAVPRGRWRWHPPPRLLFSSTYMALVLAHPSAPGEAATPEALQASTTAVLTALFSTEVAAAMKRKGARGQERRG